MFWNDWKLLCALNIVIYLLPPLCVLRWQSKCICYKMKWDGCAHERNLYWESSHAILK